METSTRHDAQTESNHQCGYLSQYDLKLNSQLLGGKTGKGILKELSVGGRNAKKVSSYLYNRFQVKLHLVRQQL